MITIGVPKDKSKFVVVDSTLSKKLQRLGFIPLYRQLGKNKIYYLKTKEIQSIIKGEKS